MIVSVENGDQGKVFDCNGKHIDDKITICNLETGEAIRHVLDDKGNTQANPHNDKLEAWKETVFYENLPLTFKRD